MKTELILLANAYMEVLTWNDYNGTHSQIVRTVPYTSVAGAEAADIKVQLNKYESVQPKGR